MSQDPSWVNLNPDPHDINSSNLFYNAQEQQISLTPVYSREEFSQVLSLLPAQYPNINFSYLRRLDGFNDLGDQKEKVTEYPNLQEYASEEVFLNRLGQELNQQGQSNVGSKKTSSFLSSSSNISHSSQIVPQKSKFHEEEKENKASEDETLTFKDLRNLDVQMAEGYRIKPSQSNEIYLENIIFQEKTNNYEELLKKFFEKVHQDVIEMEIFELESFGDVLVKVFVRQKELVQFIGKQQKAKEQVCELLLTYLCPLILKKFKASLNFENDNRDNINFNKNPHNNSKSSADFNYNWKNNESESDDSEPLCKNYNSMISENNTNNENDYRAKIEAFLRKRTFTFHNFLSELKNELLTNNKNNKNSLSRKNLEKDTMKEAVKALKLLFIYYKLVEKQTDYHEFTLFCQYVNGEFVVSVLKSINEDKKTVLSTGKHFYRAFAIYFALISFFDTHLARSFRSINDVYEEIRKRDKTLAYDSKNPFINEEEAKGLDLVSQDLLNEIDNYK